MSPEEAGVVGVRSVVRSLRGGPSMGLRKRSKAKHPRPSPTSIQQEQERQPSRLADRAEGRSLGSGEEKAKKRFKRKTGTRRMH